MQRNHPMNRPLASLAVAAFSLLTPCCTSMAQNLMTNPTGVSQQPVSTVPAIAPALPPSPTSPAPAAAAPPPQPPQGKRRGDAPQEPEAGAPQGESSAAIASIPPQNAGNAALASMSLFSVTVPPPKKFAKHDVIQVLINESSEQNFTQTTDFKKDYNLNGQLTNFPSLSQLFGHGTLTEGIGSVKPAIGVTGNKELKGNGQLDRKDLITDKIEAFIVDIKPNGNLVLEARSFRGSDKEKTTIVLSGTCRPEDITKNNTVQSNQLAGLTVRMDHEGDVKDSGQKGFIARALEAIFSF